MDPLLHGYIDGELDAVTNRSIEEHLATCPSCTQDLASFRQLRVALRRPDVYRSAPDGLARRVRAEVVNSHEVRQQWKFNWRPLAAAVSLALFFAAGWGLGHGGARVHPNMVVADTSQAIAADVVSAHIRSLMADHLVDVRSSDKHTVKPWFDGKLDFAPPIQRLDGTDFPLVGGRLDYIDGHQAAAVVYRHGKHLINLFIWPTTAPDSPPIASTERGYNLIHWNRHGMSFWVTSDVSEDELRTFVDLIRK
jgi:anti-sigma factor RsiW